jgi:hypothetical protein
MSSLCIPFAPFPLCKGRGSVKLAREAIGLLEEMSPRKGQRQRGIQMVADWIQNNTQVSVTKQTAPDLLGMAADIRLAIATQKERLEAMNAESDAELLAQIANTSQSLAEALNQLATMAEQAEKATIVEHGVRMAG